MDSSGHYSRVVLALGTGGKKHIKPRLRSRGVSKPSVGSRTVSKSLVVQRLLTVLKPRYYILVSGLREEVLCSV